MPKSCYLYVGKVCSFPCLDAGINPSQVLVVAYPSHTALFNFVQTGDIR